jgi:hypothetical protein
MDHDTYVVSLVGDDIAHPHKHFTEREAARKHAATFDENPIIERADIYKMTGYLDARSAIEARERGEGELIDPRDHKPSEVETRQRIERAGGLANYLGLVKRVKIDRRF